MKEDFTYKHNSDSGDPADQLLSRASIPWKQSKEEVWKDISAKIKKEGGDQEIHKRFLPGKQWLALAASITLLISVTGFLRFYSVETSTLLAETHTLVLPDGSSVELNENTTISYHPYWWRVSRSVKLEGEAWFLVEKGSNFRVESALAVTEVLGTSFNVLARDEIYQVSCHTGRVSVSASLSKDRAILDPGKQVELSSVGALEVTDMRYVGDTPGWLNRNIMFSSTPLQLVFEEIEKQYGIEIDGSRLPELLYSGNFSTNLPLENVLTLLCRPFKLRYEKITGKKYIIYPAPE
jgi:transmembrane sensor